MAEHIEEHYPDSRVELIGGGRGDFIVIVEGRRIWDKRGNGQGFPNEDQILREIDRIAG